MTTTLNLSERSLPALRRFALALQNGDAHAAIGRAVVDLIQKHFHSLPPNQRHFPTTHFWQRAADATTCATESNAVTININQIGIRQRLFGGPIKPVRGKYLTIPAIAETYGHVAADFGNLKIARAIRPDDHTASLALVPDELPLEKNQPINPGSVYFWLVQSVHQEPNPDVLPSDDEILSTAEHALRNALK
jgi:hypothetical protein